MDRRITTLSNLQILIIALLSVITPFLDYRFLPLSLIFIFFTIKNILLRMIFIGPGNPKPSLNSPKHTVEFHQWEGGKTCFHSHFYDKVSDLVIFIHGWESSSGRFDHRIDLFSERGFHTLAIDMRGHGNSSKTAEWTAGKVINDLKDILKKIGQDKISKVHFYGHSLGGFITLGLQNDRHQGWWKDKLGTIILESPMTGYSFILSDITKRFRIYEPLMRILALRGFNKIHPEVGGILWEDIDIPKWGVPECPTLILQAKDDNRLGREHYNLLTNQDFTFESHLLESLTHSRNRINKERDALIVDWIENPR